MNDATYFLIVNLIGRVYWRQGLLGAEYLPVSGPAVLVGNHLANMGPIGTVCSIHLRIYPWIIVDMVDKQLAGDYLAMDFVEPVLKLKPPLSKLVAKALSFITVPLLTSMGCIPINRRDPHQIIEALNATVTLLKQGKVVMIFPEEPKWEVDPQTQMRPFMTGFTRLGELFYRETGHLLSFYPVAIHSSKKVMLGEPISYEPTNSHTHEKRRLKNLLEKRIQLMYLELEQKTSM